MTTSGHTQATSQLTSRDLLCLRWIGLQYAARFDQVQRLLYRHTPAEDRYKLKPNVDSLSQDRTYELLRKWATLGYMEKKIILHGDQLWVWLSREGLRVTQLPFQYGDGQPSSVRLPHLYSINQVRLAVEARRPGDLWTSEREIRREMGVLIKGERRPHTPDALLTNMTNGKVTTIEVERTAKTESALLEDLRELAVTYTSIWYFATPATKKLLEAKLADFPPPMRKPFRLYSLTEYGDAYGLDSPITPPLF
jgi:hypothetical protein